MSSSPDELQDNLETSEEKPFDLEASIKSLMIKVAAASVPPQSKIAQDILLSIVQNLSTDTRYKDVFSFADRIVELSMNVLIMLEVTEDNPHIPTQMLHQALEDVKAFVLSAHRWNSYHASTDIVRKVMSRKSRDLEQRILSIRKDLEASLFNVQDETPTRAISEEFCNKFEESSFVPGVVSLAKACSISSNLFPNASNFTVKDSQFYSLPAGSVHFVTNHVVKSSYNAGHPDFLGLPYYDELELEMELYQSKEYRIHRGRAAGRAVAVKVFQGPRAKQLCLKTAEYNRSLLYVGANNLVDSRKLIAIERHPNVLQMIGGPDRNSGSFFLVFDGDHQGTVESQLGLALNKGIKEGCVVGANTVVACSLGVDYLQQMGLPFSIMRPEDFILLVSKQGRIVLSFDANTSWDADNNNSYDQSAIVQPDKAVKICHELIQKTFYTSCRKYYQGQRLYDDDDNDQRNQICFENDDENEQQRFPYPDQDALAPGPASRKSPRKAKGHRRELVWKPYSTSSISLAKLGRHYQASLPRFRSENVLVHRRVHYMTQTTHHCPGYQRTEIILTPDIDRSGIVSHNFPVLNEICSVCGANVGTTEIVEYPERPNIGRFTDALIQLLEQNLNLPYQQLLQALTPILHSRHRQSPQLSSSHPKAELDKPRRITVLLDACHSGSLLDLSNLKKGMPRRT